MCWRSTTLIMDVQLLFGFIRAAFKSATTVLFHFYLLLVGNIFWTITGISFNLIQAIKMDNIMKKASIQQVEWNHWIIEFSSNLMKTKIKYCDSKHWINKWTSKCVKLMCRLNIEFLIVALFNAYIEAFFRLEWKSTKTMDSATMNNIKYYESNQVKSYTKNGFQFNNLIAKNSFQKQHRDLTSANARKKVCS